jgi:hypothetical protein
MIQLTVGSIMCLVVAAFIVGVACIIALLTRITAHQDSAIGCSVLVVFFLCTIAGLLLWAGLSQATLVF